MRLSLKENARTAQNPNVQEEPAPCDHNGALVLFVCGAVLGVAGCGQPTVSVQAEPATPGADPAAIAGDLGNKYAELMATATTRRVTATDLAAANIAADTPRVRALLDYYTCGYGEDQGWSKRGKSTWESHVDSTTWNTPEEILARVTIDVQNSADTATAGAHHILRIQRRNGTWTIIGDSINYPMLGSPSESEGGPPGEAIPNSGADTSDTSLGMCAPPDMSS